MTTLILDTPDHCLSLKDGSLLHISHPQQESRSLPLFAIERIVLGRGITISSDLQLTLAELGKELVLLGHKSSAMLINPSYSPSNLRLLQYQAVSQEEVRARLALALLEVRRRGQNRVLRRLGMPALPTPLSVPDNLMLYEAKMSRTYWRAWASCFKTEGFVGRERQPPMDPVNALLSLTSTLEDGVLAAPLLAEGFDLTLGFHHRTGYRRPSLVLDIKELTRAELELWVLVQWQLGRLGCEHFEQTEAGCRLNRVGQQVFYPAWFGWQKQRKAHLRRMVRLCRRRLERECAYD